MIATHHEENQIIANIKAPYRSSLVILILIIRRDIASNY